jgi:predicted ATPase
LAGRSYEAELGAPYTMWAEALSTLNTEEWRSRLVGLPSIWLQQLARLVPGLAEPLADDINTSSAENHLRFMQGIVNSLTHLSQDAPLLLFFDDLHWSDTASLELLHYAARQSLAHPILIIGAYRSDSIDAKERIKPFINERRHPTIELSPLRQEDIKALLPELDLPDSTAVVSRLHQHCHGNRLMLVETLRLLQESGSLNQLEADDKLPIPPRIQDLIEARLTRLRERQRRLLAAAAVIGRPFDSTLLRQVSGQPELAVLEEVESLIAGAFLEEGQGSSSEQISFHHDYVRQLTIESLRPGQRRALHRRTADALLVIHQSRLDLVVEEVALHFEQAGDDRALPYLLQAAEQAESLYALPEAAQLLTRGLDFQERHFAQDVNGRFDILLARENLLAQQGQQSARAADISSLLSLAEKVASAQRQAQAWVRQAGYLSDTHQGQESKLAADKALSLYRLEQDRHGEAQALRELGFLYWSTNEYGLALEYGRHALQLHRQLGDLEGEATALHNLAEIHRGLDSPRLAVTFYEQSLQLHWARQDHQRQSLSLYGMAHAMRQLGRRQQALEKYQQALAQTDLAGDRVLASRVYHELATLSVEMGDLDQAIIAMQQAAAISREIGYAPGLAHSLFGLSYLYARSQQTDNARAALLESADWFRVMEDQECLQIVEQRIRQL